VSVPVIYSLAELSGANGVDAVTDRDNGIKFKMVGAVLFAITGSYQEFLGN